MDSSPCSQTDECSLDGQALNSMAPPSPVSREQLQKRIDSLNQHNRVLITELETYKIRCKQLLEENKTLRQASVNIQAKAEQEEEYISNTLLKKIQALKKEKETLAHHFEREEECLTNDLSRKLDQLRQEKCKLELTLEFEQECLVNKLMRKIEKLEAETLVKQNNLEQLRREMVELENTLEQEQEALVNKLWKRMDKLEAEKRSLQIRLDQPVSDLVPITQKQNQSNVKGNEASALTSHIQTLRSEVEKLRNNLAAAERESLEKTQHFAQEERHIREENLRLQRKLQLEVERREALCRHLSESESSLEMEEERIFNENVGLARTRTISSPIPHSSGEQQDYSKEVGPTIGRLRPIVCDACGQLLGRRSERFIKPAIPNLGMNTSAPNVLASGSLSSHINNNGGSNSLSSLNNSLSSTSSSSTLPFLSSGHISTSFVQPASPMDTETKE